MSDALPPSGSILSSISSDLVGALFTALTVTGYVLLFAAYAVLVFGSGAAIGDWINIGATPGHSAGVGVVASYAFCFVAMMFEASTDGVEARKDWSFLHTCLVVMLRTYIIGLGPFALLGAVFVRIRKIVRKASEPLEDW